MTASSKLTVFEDVCGLYSRCKRRHISKPLVFCSTALMMSKTFPLTKLFNDIAMPRAMTCCSTVIVVTEMAVACRAACSSKVSPPPGKPLNQLLNLKLKSSKVISLPSHSLGRPSCLSELTPMDQTLSNSSLVRPATKGVVIEAKQAQ